MNDLLPLFAQADAETTNTTLGVAIFVLGGLAGATFYLPFKRVKNWSWETYWFIYSVAALLVMPWVLAFVFSPNVVSVLQQAPGKEIGFCLLFGAMWGIGNLTWGLMIRYLGFGLGLALGCGLCSAAGTIIPPIAKGEFGALFETSAGIVSLVGVAVSLIGIFFVGGAGISKEKELPEEVKKASVAEYNFKLGIIAVIFSGLMSSALNFGFQSGGTIEALATTVEPVTSNTWRGMPVLAVALFGGFVINGGWSLILNFKNRTLGDYTKAETPKISNLFFAALAGVIWCSQWVCFKTGEPEMGSLGYIGWSTLFASTIFFSTLLGIILGEWKGTSGRTKMLLGIGLLVLVISTCVFAYSGSLKTETPAADQVTVESTETP